MILSPAPLRQKRLHTRVFNSLFVNLACENKSLKVNFNTIYKTFYTCNLVVKNLF